MMGLPVRVIVTSEIKRLDAGLATVPFPARTAVRRPFMLAAAPDFCMAVDVASVN